MDLIHAYFRLEEEKYPEQVEASYAEHLPLISLALRRVVTKIDLKKDEHDAKRVELMLGDFESAMLIATQCIPVNAYVEYVDRIRDIIARRNAAGQQS